MSWVQATWRAAVIGRWIARIGGTFMALFLLAFLVGEGPPPFWRLSWHENLGLLGLYALFLGLLLGWKWEFWGGAVPIAGFLLTGFVSHERFGNFLFVLPAAFGALYLLCWARLRAGAPAAGEAWQVPKRTLAVAGIVAGVFILLSANEMFGNPPLMTPAFHGSPETVGRWRSPLTPAPAAVPGEFQAALIIGVDGSLTGTIGNAQVTGRIENNRSWFGRLMHWREDYALRGALSQPVGFHGEAVADRFTGLLMARGGNLEGVLYLANRPLRVRMVKE
jgi:hypothetical protein